MRITFSFYFIIPILFIFIACSDGDKFSSDPNLKLEFSTNTVSFDTIFTTIPSPTRRIKVYNRNNNSITFDKIELVNPLQSGYRINVDGWAANSVEDIDLLKKDSLYIAIDINASKLEGGSPQIRDHIRLSWNGNTHDIELNAHGLDVEIYNIKTIDANTSIIAGTSYYIKDKLIIKEGVIVEVEPGVTFYFDKKARMEINGTILANGTPEKPITFRGHRFDNIERNIPYDNAFDQWRGIFVGANSYNNVFNNVRIRSSQIGLDFAKSTTTSKKASVINTVIHNSYDHGVTARNCKIDFTNTQISNSRGSLVNLLGGNNTFLHCTIANYYQWQPRTLSSIIIREETDAVLEKAEFVNSVLVGSFRDELSIMTSRDNPKCNFTNCVIQAIREDNTAPFVNVIWNIPAAFLFKDLNSKKRFFYSFELLENSSARNKASSSHSQSVPTDLRGISRLSDDKPDIGCYEFVE